MTLRQKALAKEILENTSPTIKDAMIKVGYAPSTATTPSEITEGKGFQDYLSKLLPDGDLLTVTAQALKANKIVSSHTEPDYEYPDHPTRLKAAEQGYKLKGKLKEGLNVQGDLNFNVTIVRHPVE